MEFCTFQDARLLAWAARQLGLQLREDTCRWVAGLDAGGIVFVVVYHGFSERDCGLTIATDGSKRWASRAMLRRIFALPFIEWNLQRVTMIVRADNVRSLRMMDHRGRSPLGVVQEGRLRDYYADGVDALVFGMKRSECRWVAS